MSLVGQERSLAYGSFLDRLVRPRSVHSKPFLLTVHMRDFDKLPYELHTGHELRLMLEGRKPLACFGHEYPSVPLEEIIPEAAFQAHVETGRFLKRDYVELSVGAIPSSRSNIKGVRHVFYSLPSESWRIDAYIAMKAQAAVSGWSEEMERLQGRLLGYEDWQTDAWIAMLLARPQSRSFPWLARLADKRRQQEVTNRDAAERIDSGRA